MSPLEVLASHADKPFSFDNQFLRASAISIFPIQANSSVTDIEDSLTGGKKSMTWYQLIAQYKSVYTSNSETGEVLSDNATVKQMKIKFPPESIQGVTASRFKDFFDTHFVGKKSLILPTISESQSFDRQGGKAIPVKNSTDILVDPSFKLIDYIKEYEDKQKLEKK